VGYIPSKRIEEVPNHSGGTVLDVSFVLIFASQRQYNKNILCARTSGRVDERLYACAELMN
jgi:hypothetical protein